MLEIGSTKVGQWEVTFVNKEEKLVDAVWTLIRETPFAPGDRLPSERALAVRLGVNRHTLRGALRRMAARGVLAIRPGSGGEFGYMVREAAGVVEQVLRRA